MVYSNLPLKGVISGDLADVHAGNLGQQQVHVLVAGLALHLPLPPLGAPLHVGPAARPVWPGGRGERGWGERKGGEGVGGEEGGERGASRCRFGYAGK